MGRIQSSIGLITGTDIGGTVDQLIALSARPRDRLLARTESLQLEQQALAELTAAVIGVQFAGNQLGSTGLFRSKQAESSNIDSVSAEAGNGATAGTYVVRTLRTAASHSIDSLRRFAAIDQPLGFEGSLSIQPAGGSIDESASLSSLNGGRGVEAGVIRITDRSGKSAEIDVSGAQDINDVLARINDAEIDVFASTSGNAITLRDRTGSDVSNLKVEQVGNRETAADLGLWGISSASSEVSGAELDLSPDTKTLRGVLLSELNGGRGIEPLTSLNIALSDGSSANIDVSEAKTTGEIIDAIADSGLSLIVGLNDARNGFRIRDVSGGNGSVTIASGDATAAGLGLEAANAGDILVGRNLNRQMVNAETFLSDLNPSGEALGGSFTIQDSAGALGAVNLTVEGITTVGGLLKAINALEIDVTAQLNDAGDGIAIVDQAGGSSVLTIEDTGNGTAAASLGISGTATSKEIRGAVVPALVGSRTVHLSVDASDTLESLVAKINEQGQYAEASIRSNEDGSASLRVRSLKGGLAGRIGINSTGFKLDLRTDVRGQDALIAISTDGGTERLLNSTDGVFEIGDVTSTRVTQSTPLADLSSEAGRGSFTITDSAGEIRAINIAVDSIESVGDLISAINGLGMGVRASINDAGTGIAIVDTAAGTGSLTISDTGSGKVASSLGIDGTATTKVIGGRSVNAIAGPAGSAEDLESKGLVLTLKALSETPTIITVGKDSEAVLTATKTFVDQYNLLVEKLDTLTSYDADSEQAGLLFGSSEALRIRNGYSRLLSGRIGAAGEFRSLGQVGLRLNEEGKLDLNAEKLSAAISNNHDDVEDFFTIDGTGLVDRLGDFADRIAGIENGLLLNRGETLAAQIDSNSERVEALNTRLEKERERLLRRFYATEEAIAKIQSNQSAIAQIRPVSIPTS